MIGKGQALKLRAGAEIYQLGSENADGTPTRWRVSGKCKVWKRDLKRFKVPIKHGLYEHAYLTEENKELFTTSKSAAERKLKVGKKKVNKVPISKSNNNMFIG